MATETETLKKDIDALRSSIDKLTKDMSTMSESFAQDMKARAANKVGDLREEVSHIAGRIGAKGKQSSEAVEESVREKPLQSILLALGAGLMLAQLMRGR